MSKYKRMASAIIDLFEELLDKHGIMIPDEDRIGDASEAPIYGATYGDLQDDIVDILESFEGAED